MIRLAIRFNGDSVNDMPTYFNISTYAGLFKKHYEERDYFAAYLLLSKFISDDGYIYYHFPYVNCINTRTRYMK